MSSINLRLPNSLHDDLRTCAKDDGVSLNQFIITALAKETAVFKHISPKSKAEHLMILRNLPSGKDISKEDEDLIEEEVRAHRKS